MRMHSGRSRDYPTREETGENLEKEVGHRHPTGQAVGFHQCPSQSKARPAAGAEERLSFFCFPLPFSLSDVSDCCSKTPIQNSLCGHESLWSHSQKDSHLHNEKRVKRMMFVSLICLGGNSLIVGFVLFCLENKMLYMLIAKFSPN